MIKALRLRNLRSFPNSQDASYVDLKPLTVLVGKNSSGKSSFLRSFPLLRQSVEAKTTGPILWYGSYVDFGAFSEAIKHDCNEQIIYFDFKLKINIRRRASFRRRLLRVVTRAEEILVNIEVGVAEQADKTVAKQIKLNIHGDEFLFQFDKGKKCSLSINSEPAILSDS